MNVEIIRYRSRLKKGLHCGRVKRRKLMEQFERSLSCFLEDYPSPTYAELTDAFGSPEEMASVLMENVTEEEQEWYRKRKKLLKILAGLAIALLVVYTVYLYFIKEYSVVVIYDELIPVQSALALRRY